MRHERDPRRDRPWFMAVFMPLFSVALAGSGMVAADTHREVVGLWIVGNLLGGMIPMIGILHSLSHLDFPAPLGRDYYVTQIRTCLPMATFCMVNVSVTGALLYWR